MQNPLLERTLKMAKIIAGAIMASLLIYVMIAEFYIFKSAKSPFPQYSTIKYILYALAGIQSFVIILFYHYRLQKVGKLSSQILNSMKHHYQSMNIPADEQEITFCQRLLFTNIITFALCESIAVFGVVLFILGKQRQDLYILVGLSLLLMLVYFPTSEKWRNRLEQFRISNQNQHAEKRNHIF